MKSYIKVNLLVFLMLALNSVILHAQADLSLIDKNQIKTNQLAYAKILAWELAPIKTEEALQLELIKENSPLNLLSEHAKQAFVDSIVFRKNGLGGFYYGDLEAELTPVQIYKILSLFGAQHTVHLFKNARVEIPADALLLSPVLINSAKQRPSGMPGGGGSSDHMGYKCQSRATCDQAKRMICMSSC